MSMSVSMSTATDPAQASNGHVLGRIKRAASQGKTMQ